MEKLIIRKRKEVACFKVMADAVCPNTEIEIDDGLVLVIRVEGEEKMSAKRSFVMNSLINPGKAAKLFGGKKPYSSCEIYAIDTLTEFNSEWGFGGPTAIPCYDADFEVEAKAVCFGEFTYRIDDYFAFVRALPLDEKDEFSRADVREYFRNITVNVVRPYLVGKLAGKNLPDAQSEIQKYSDSIKDRLNDEFDLKGITVNNFAISRLEYENSHIANREALRNAKIDVKIKGVVNEGKRDDISVNRAENEANAIGSGAQAASVRCPRCGEMNSASANYCTRCSEPLRKLN